MKTLGSIPFRALAAALALSAALVFAAGCSAQQAASSASGTPSQGSGSGPTPEQYETVLSPTGVVSTFIGEIVCDQKIEDADGALAAVKGAFDRIGADGTTELEATAIRPTETGTTYYIFNQVAGDVLVHGASVKLIVDKDGTAIGLVSAILPNVELSSAEEWGATAEQAEAIVVKKCEEDGHANMKPVDGATEQVLIPIPNRAERHQYAWVVYTSNYDASSEMAYLAHYVDATGVYLYAIPIAEPHNADAEAGDVANFNFAKFEQGTWEGALTLHDGATKEAQVPVLVDKDSNTTFLADGKRKILCADYAEWAFEEKLSPRASTDGTFDNVELLAYDTFIQVWDFYDGIGWTGPDDEGTPTLLLMDYVDKDGEPVDSAMYSGRQNGFQVFTFNRLNPDGENVDVIAHEFTHCVTTTTMTTNLYLNDTGAINEGMSDILGNLAEMLLTDKPESAWLIGDSSGGGTLRSMKDPREFRQPEFKWDTFYVRSVLTGTEINDRGGVHFNSSLLNVISYKLDQAGMRPDDQFFFWMNVALAMTPRTDYEQMAQLLPWCLEHSGYGQYADALGAAIDEGRFTVMQEPETLPAGMGRAVIQFDAPELNDKGLALFTFIRTNDGDDSKMWPVPGAAKATCVLPAGDYLCHALLGAADVADCPVYYYSGDGWEAGTGEGLEMGFVHVEEGKTVELPVSGLPTTPDAIVK